MAPKRKNFFDGFLYVLNTIAAFALLCSYLSNYISPRIFTWFSFLGLAYPYLLVANILFAIWWALRLKTKIILPIIAIAVGYKQIPLVYQFGASKQVVASGEALKVMTFNVHNLNRYQWIDEEDVPARIEQLIKEEQPDIVLMQEYYRLEEPLNPDMPHVYFEFQDKAGKNGQIIYSRLPILDKGFYPLPAPEGAIAKGKALWVDVEWQGRSLRLYNLHLYSVGLAGDDYENLSQQSEESNEEFQKRMYRIGGSLNRAFERRAYQVEFLDSIFQAHEGPIIVGGDFNDPPSSYTFHKLHEHLQDSYVSAGEGWVRTFNRGPLPFRIDHILYRDKELRCHSYKVVQQKLSDHYPVLAEFSWR
ncbi:endonuclease/exonuclease/phosphatase family protein [Croceimicrobium sp.]|uniref:endonuclease/exonuclease/phosphatase family protein n=1 Tax=Croceimicrobium sp. TaxID=2828340 RepID=UPI003BAB923B